MGNRLPRGLGGRGHWLVMLGADQGKVKKRQGLEGLVGVGRCSKGSLLSAIEGDLHIRFKATG
jgi:hypothetical protein